jgi:citrate lyase subunit beta/citryl-CoA lyase
MRSRISPGHARRPDGIVLRSRLGEQSRGSATTCRAGGARGSRPGATRILPSRPRPQLRCSSWQLRGASARLAGLTWGAEDLPAALGASTNRGPDGELAFVYQLARALCLAGAVAASVQPIDTVYPDFRDSAGLEKTCARARMDGFTGKIAIHPDQVAVIQRAFSPTPEEVAHARRVIAAFRANPERARSGSTARCSTSRT